MANEVLYIKVKDDIKKKIEKGTFKEGDRIPPFVDLAKEYNVSLITIRQAISQLVNEGYVETKGRSGTYVKRKDKIRSKVVAILSHSDLRNPFIGEIYSGISRVLCGEGYHTLFYNYNTENAVDKSSYLKDLLKKIDGLILIPADPETTSRLNSILNEFKEKNIPIILVDTKIEGLDFDYIETDNFNAAYKATKYLIEKGHREIGIILGIRVNTIEERYQGYLKALEDHNIEPNILYVKWHSYQKYYEETGYICGLELLNLKKPPTAIFCTSDAMATGLYKACSEMGLNIPDDISVIGFDNLRLTEYLLPPLTTVHQEKEKMGEEAAKILLARINGDTSPPKQLTLDFHILERNSVKDIRTSQ